MTRPLVARRAARFAPILALHAVIGGGCATHDVAPSRERAEGALTGTRYEIGRRFASKYCVECHAKDGRDPKQKVAYPAFHADTYDDWVSSRTILLAVVDKWNPDGDVMPPPDALEPPDEERRLILDWIRRGSPNTSDGK